jgi:hypothetical protein
MLVDDDDWPGDDLHRPTPRLRDAVNEARQEPLIRADASW